MLLQNPNLSPSVLGLSPGAFIVTPVMLNWWTEKKSKCPILLLSDVIPLILELFTNANPMF